MDKVYIKHFFAALLYFLPLFLTAQTAGKEKPNIIFIMADDLGWGELEAYGNTFNETPNLNKLAAEGMKFMQAYAAAPVCSPTRASLMTGQYPARVRITDFLPEKEKTERYLDPDKYITINEALSKAGYHTGIVGKWHLDTHFDNLLGGPEQHGFDEVIGSETKYIADGDYFFPYDKTNTLKDGKDGEYLTDRQSLEACRFIERNKKSPFFLYLSYYSVHTKLEAKQALIDKYKKKFNTKYGAGKAEEIFEGDNVRHEAKHLDNPYLAAMLESIDTGVGEVMKTLKKNGLEKNTILIFFSDNGGAGRVANNGHLRMNKTWLYEGGIREPLLVRWPDRIKPGSVSDVPVFSVDFYPTFIEAAGANKPQGHILDGKSLLPLLTKGVKPDRDTFFWHYPSETGKWKERMSSAVRQGDYKLIYFYKKDQYELYDLKNDPGETTDLSEKMPEKTAALKILLNDWKKEVNAEEPDLTAVQAKKKKQ